MSTQVLICPLPGHLRCSLSFTMSFEMLLVPYQVFSGAIFPLPGPPRYYLSFTRSSQVLHVLTGATCPLPGPPRYYLSFTRFSQVLLVLYQVLSCATWPLSGPLVVNSLLHKGFSNPYQSRYNSISLYSQCQTGHNLSLSGTINVSTWTRSLNSELSMPQLGHDLININVVNDLLHKSFSGATCLLPCPPRG